MSEKMRGIVLAIKKHNETTDIITVYSRTHGRLVFLSPLSNSRGGRLRNARLQPLVIIEADIRLKMNSEFQRLGSFSLSRVCKDIYFNPAKQMIVIFLSEFLNKLLSARMKDEALWDYIDASLSLLDSLEKGFNNFHIVFLSSLLSFLGIQPDPYDYKQGYYFDMRTGSFTEELPSHPDFLNSEESLLASKLLRLDFSNMRALKLTTSQRFEVLQYLLKYYEIHFPGTGNLKSLPILHSLFSH